MYEIDRAPVLTGEVLDPQDYIALLYDKAGVEDTLVIYLNSRDAERSEDIVMNAIAGFSADLGDASVDENGIDIDLIRFGFEHLVDSMDKVASDKYGYARESVTKNLMTIMGFKEPKPRQYVRKLPEEYWRDQFLTEYNREDFSRRYPDETEEQHLARYIEQSIRGFIVAPFTYL